MTDDPVYARTRPRRVRPRCATVQLAADEPHAPREDLVRACLDCRNGFVIRAEEQQWWIQHAAEYPDRAVSLPWRCHPCRLAARHR